MQNVYFKAIKATGKNSDFFRSAAVAYMTINMTIASIQSEKIDSVITKESSECQLWISNQTKDNSPSASLLASVEIVGTGKALRIKFKPKICSSFFLVRSFLFFLIILLSSSFFFLIHFIPLFLLVSPFFSFFFICMCLCSTIVVSLHLHLRYSLSSPSSSFASPLIPLLQISYSTPSSTFTLFYLVLLFQSFILIYFFFFFFFFFFSSFPIIQF